MNDALLVRRLERTRDIPPDGESLLRAEAAGFTPGPAGIVLQPFPKRRPLDQLQHQARRAADVGDPMDGADVGMVQRREDACLTIEPREAPWIRREDSAAGS